MRMPLFKKKLSGHLSAKSHGYEGLEEWNMDTCDKFIRTSLYELKFIHTKEYTRLVAA